MKKILILAIVSFFTFGVNAQVLDAKAAKKAAKEQAAKTKADKKSPGESVSVAPISKDPSMYIASDVVDYGIISQNADGTRAFKVTNKGAQPLLITNCSGSCGCTVPTCPREPILPGKSAEISIKYATDRIGPINKTVTIMSNDPVTPNRTIMVKGEVKAN